MNTIALDTHRAIRRLMETGLPAHQAEAIVETVIDTQLVTTSDLDVAVETLEQRISVQLYKAMLIQTGAIVATLSGLYAIFG